MKRIILSVLALAVFGLSSCLKVNFEEYITNNNGGSSTATDTKTLQPMEELFKGF